MKNSTQSTNSYRKLRLKDIKPKLTSSRVSLMEATHESLAFQITEQPSVKKMQRSSTHKDLLRLKKNVLTSTMIQRKSSNKVMYNMSAIKEHASMHMKRREHEPCQISSYEWQKLNYPIQYAPEMRVKDIDRSAEYRITEFINESAATSQLMYYGDYNVWVV